MARVTREVARSGKPFKTVVNDAIRRGLHPQAKPDQPPFRIHVRDLGARDGFDFDCVWDLLDRLDGPGAR